MGKTKSRTVRRTTKELVEQGIEFTEDFAKNKAIIRPLVTSRKLKNQIAGYLCRMIKQKNKREAELEVK